MTNRIIIIDDDLYIRELYEEVLKNAGYTVETANNGKDGLEKLQQGGYDVVVLDVMLPLLDGLGIITKLEEKPPKEKNGPIIFFTNLSNDPIVKQATEKGVFACLIKAEITPEQFLQKVQEAASPTGT